MKNVVKKWSIYIVIIMIMNGLFLSTVHAEQINNLKDCLEKDEDCLQLNETPTMESHDDESNLTENDTLGSSFLLNILKMFFALLLILALIFFIAKLWNRKNNQLQQSNILENLGGIPLGQNKSLQIVRIGNRFYVLGIGESVELLMEITDDHITEQFVQYGEESEDFKTVFQNIFKNRKTDKGKNKDANEPFLSSLSKELDLLKHRRTSLVNDNRKKDDPDE